MAAKFKEWPLQNATLKRVYMNGEAILQLKFGWDPLTNKYSAGSASRVNPCTLATRGKASGAKRSLITSGAFTRTEDELLVQLNEGPDKLTWLDIHRRFDHGFPERRC